MSKRTTYTNRKGRIYFFRKVTGKRGERIVCSQKESADDLASIPDTHEVVESPNGQVSCRKKMVSEILSEEIALAKELCAKRVKKGVRVEVELKKKTIIIHSADTADLNEFAKFALRLAPGQDGIQAIVENNIYFEPVLKLELSNKESRGFSISRMCWVGKCDWLFLEEGRLAALLKTYVPHIEQESFYELV